MDIITQRELDSREREREMMMMMMNTNEKINASCETNRKKFTKEKLVSPEESGIRW